MPSNPAPRIAHVCYAGTSGASRVALNIARGSKEPARHAYVLFGAGAVRDDYLEELRERACTFVHVPKNSSVDLGAYRRAAKAALDTQPAAIVLHGSRLLPVAFWIKRLDKRTPLIGVQHGPTRELTEWSRRQVCRLFARTVDRSVTVSRDMAEIVARYGGLAKACEPLAVIPNGVEMLFWRVPPPDFSGVKIWRIGMIATLEAYKDHATLLRAFKRLRESGRDLRLEFVGTGPLDEPLRALALELDVRDDTIFRGNLRQADVRRAMHSFHILAHATHSESFGMAAAEGLAAGRAVVASDVPGLRSVVRHEQTGLLVPEGDDAAWAAALARLMDDPVLARGLALAGQAYAQQHFSAKRMAADYEALADETIKGAS